MDKDQYSITLDAKRHLVHVVANGQLNREDGEEVITQALTTAAKHGYNIYCDVRKTEVKVTLADWVYKKYGMEDKLSDDFFHRAGREIASASQKLGIDCR